MMKSRYSDSQILSILKQAENGIAMSELYRKHGMNNATFYKWGRNTAAWTYPSWPDEGT